MASSARRRGADAREGLVEGHRLGVQLFRPPEGREGESIVGVVGELQFDVVKHRLAAEYSVDVRVERLSFTMARWVEGEGVPLAQLEDQLYGCGALDVYGSPVVLFKGEWHCR